MGKPLALSVMRNVSRLHRDPVLAKAESIRFPAMNVQRQKHRLIFSSPPKLIQNVFPKLRQAELTILRPSTSYYHERLGMILGWGRLYHYLLNLWVLLHDYAT